MCSHITQNWREQPLISLQVIVNLIAATRIRNDLAIQAELDDNVYPLCIKVSNEQMDNLDIRRHAFHGEWNYTLRQRT